MPQHPVFKRPKRSSNKVYRTPPTPEQDELLDREQSFVLDCCASRNVADEFAKVNPKMAPVLPSYNAQLDKHTWRYYRFAGLGRTLRKTGQDAPGTSIEGAIQDRFSSAGAGRRYLSLRNATGAGHSKESVQSHQRFMTPSQDVIGYNGYFGYRRNTPWLRTSPSPFGMVNNFPLGWPDEEKPRGLKC